MNFWDKLFINGIKSFPYGSIKIKFPNGEVEKIKSPRKGPAADLKIKDNQVIKEIIQGGSVRFAELYMSERLFSKDLTNLLHYFALNNDQAEATLKITLLKYFFYKFLHLRNNNTQTQSKKNISYHYDLGNQFYKLWLDETMTYSSAIFSKQNKSLEEAQIQKYSKLANLAEIKKGDKILEIGCGWGGFSEYLAKNFDCDITAITISQEQFNYGKKELKKLN